MAAISNDFDPTIGAFEDHVESKLQGCPVDIAFIDAIHTSDLVERQVGIILKIMRLGRIIVLDDVNFSADMMKCWVRLAEAPFVRAGVAFGERLGILGSKPIQGIALSEECRLTGVP